MYTNSSMEIVQLGFLNKIPEDLGKKAEISSRLQLKTAAEKTANKAYFSCLLQKKKKSKQKKTRICISS